MKIIKLKDNGNCKISRIQLSLRGEEHLHMQPITSEGKLTRCNIEIHLDLIGEIKTAVSELLVDDYLKTLPYKSGEDLL